MFNYNMISPVNIHYRKYPQSEGRVNSDEQKKQTINPDDNNQNQRRFPNGNKVAIDYTNNKINISQVLQDFRSTIAAINSPDDVKKEVEVYLTLVNNESLKNTPQRDVILSNLKNAARVTDKYIQDSLKKPSKVVQDWVDALFLQNINLKADPNEINEDFRVKIPEKKPAIAPEQAYAQNIVHHPSGIKPLNEDTVELNSDIQIEPEPVYNAAQSPFIQTDDVIDADILEGEIITQTEKETEIKPEVTIYTPKNENEQTAKQKIGEAKALYSQTNDVYNTLKLYDEALELASDNPNLKSAIYFERAKIFDTYDYPELALIDYNKATKTDDNNLKAQAHIKMGDIYDDYVQFDPAMDNYERAIQASEEINNYQGKTKALRQIASMFTKRYDADNMEAFSDLAMESAKESNNPKTIANTYLETAQNYTYIGEDSKALSIYATLAQDKTVQDDYETMAKNYMEASMLMDKKGNKQKAFALMQKSKEFQRKARLQRLSA